MTRRPGAGIDHEVVVVGDGPAGSALTTALRAVGVDVRLLGRGGPWNATYGAWVDELQGLEDLPPLDDCLAARRPAEVVTATGGRRDLHREYGSFDNARLAERLGAKSVDITEVLALQVDPSGGCEVLTDIGTLRAAMVFDARGVPAHLRDLQSIPAQTAFGVVLGQRPDLGGSGNVLMDWRRAGPISAADGFPATFAYVLDLGDGRWLVEETALAVSPPVPQQVLERRLRERIGESQVDAALATERVHIPMVPGAPRMAGAIVPFGAAAGFVHPATGYSVTASFRAASRVARAVSTGVGAGDLRADEVWAAVWPRSHRRTRALHDIGLELLVRLPPDDLDRFFDRFFTLDTQLWAEYLRIDASPARVSAAMARVFSAVPWRLRRRLVASVPRAARWRRAAW